MSLSPKNLRNFRPELTSELFWRIVEISGLRTHNSPVINKAERQEIFYITGKTFMLYPVQLPVILRTTNNSYVLPYLALKVVFAFPGFIIFENICV